MTDITKRLAEALAESTYGLERTLAGKRIVNADEIIEHGKQVLQAYYAQAGKASGWQPIETAPHEQYVLLFCPHRHESNPQRIEVGPATWGERIGQYSNRGAHSWATHWMPLPDPPEQST